MRAIAVCAAQTNRINEWFHKTVLVANAVRVASVHAGRHEDDPWQDGQGLNLPIVPLPNG
jgi:hypothetical protein